MLHIRNSFYEGICNFEGTGAIILGSFVHF